MRPRGIAFLFGVVATVLLLLATLLAAVGAIAVAFFGRGGLEGLLSSGLLSLLLAILTLFLVVYARRGRREEARVGGVVLVVLALLEWFLLGTAGELVGVLAILFTFLAGILFVLADA
jgi:hypothetical protein